MLSNSFELGRTARKRSTGETQMRYEDRAEESRTVLYFSTAIAFAAIGLVQRQRQPAAATTGTVTSLSICLSSKRQEGGNRIGRCPSHGRRARATSNCRAR